MPYYLLLALSSCTGSLCSMCVLMSSLSSKSHGEPSSLIHMISAPSCLFISLLLKTPDSNWKSFPVLVSCPAIVWSALSLTNHSNWKLLLHITESIDGWLSHSLDCDQMTGKRNQPLNTQCKTTPLPNRKGGTGWKQICDDWCFQMQDTWTGKVGTVKPLDSQSGWL